MSRRELAEAASTAFDVTNPGLRLAPSGEDPLVRDTGAGDVAGGPAREAEAGSRPPDPSVIGDR